MKQQPLISVIVPVYNVEPYLQMCLDSITEQTYRNLEICLVDDGSADKSGDVCDEYARKDNRIKIVHKKNGGVSAARNLGLKHATGDWVLFVDGDDWIDPTHVERLVAVTRNRPVDCVICGYAEEYPQNTLVRHIDIDRPLSGGQATFCMLRPDLYQGFVWNKLFKREIIACYGLCFNETLCYLEDMAFCAEFFSYTDEVCCVPDDSYHYRQRKDSAIYSSMDRSERIARRLSALDAWKVTETFCTGSRERHLCRACWHVECTQLLKFMPQAETRDSEDIWEELLANARGGCFAVLTALLPVKTKIKYMSIILLPKIFLPFWSKRETRYL